MTPNKELSHIGPRNVGKLNFKAEDCKNFEDLARLGVGLDEGDVRKMMEGVGMDSLTSPTFPVGIPTPEQFLQNWLPGWVKTMFAARKIDELIGVTTVGNWEDEEVIQGTMEPVGVAVPYGDYTNVPFASWNLGYERRSIVRFEEGMRVGVLEEKRAAKQNINSAAEKRLAASLALDIARNKVGFFGYNAATNRTYGFLNDPGLPSYVTVAVGASTFTTWASKTFLEITADLRTAFIALRVQSQDNFSPADVPVTLAISTNAVDYLSVTSTFGNSVWDWLKENYPKTRVISAPELNGANGGANVFYAYAENVSDSSSDDGRVFTQIVPARFQLVGVANLSKGYEEDYTAAFAGIMVKRPYGIVRYSGI